MSDFESFSGSDASLNAGSTPESFKEFQNRMQVASAQIKSLRAWEGKQRKKEVNLAELLSRFIKNHASDPAQQDLIVYIAKLLELNLPAAFIISLVIINYPELQQESGLVLLKPENLATANYNDLMPDLFQSGQALPAWAKLALNSWFELVQSSALQARHKLNLLIPTAVRDLFVFSLNQYLSNNNFAMTSDFIENFCNFYFKNLSEQLKQEPKQID